MEPIREIAVKLSRAGLKVTPQRVAVLKALIHSRSHPTAEELFSEVAGSLPGLSTTTIYNTLDSLVEKGLARRVKTDTDVMRYDAVMEHHHHLYGQDSDRVEDYFDPELDTILENYFRKKQIKGFKLSDVRLQLIGEFEKK